MSSTRLDQSAAFARALGRISVTVLGLVTITFVLTRLLPLDPVLAIVGHDADEATYLATAQRLGLDRPVIEQFWLFIQRISVLDLGESFLTKRPVAADLLRVIPATIELGVLGAILGAIIGTAAGVSAGARHGSWFDSVVRVGSLVLYSTPIFWLALMSLVILYSGLGIVPGPGRLDLDYLDAVPTRSGSVLVDTLLAGRPDAFLNALAHLALPLAVLTAAEAAWFARMTRAFTLEQVNQEYVLVARAKGLSERAVVWRHIFPNIRIQLITITAVALAGSLEGAVLIEAIFAWPGFGAYFVNALVKGDMNAVLGCTLVVGLLFTVSSAVAEVLYRRADPRVRT